MIEESPFPALPPEPQDPRIPWQPASAVARCEASGGHIVKPPTWPPVRKPSDRENEAPSMVLSCERCQATLIVYDDTTRGVKVIKPPPLEAVKK